MANVKLAHAWFGPAKLKPKNFGLRPYSMGDIHPGKYILIRESFEDTNLPSWQKCWKLGKVLSCDLPVQETTAIRIRLYAPDE